MINKVYFSIIIPLYNKEPHILNCINSVLEQTHQNFELIIVNDNSTDKSVEIANRINDKRIKIYNRSSPSPGGYAARNYGVEMSSYDWITFLDADDYWLPEHLSIMNKAILKYSDYQIFSTGWKIESKNNLYEQKYYLKYSKIGDHKVNLYDYLKNIIKNLRYTHPNVIVLRKEIFYNTLGFPEGKVRKGGDLLFFLKVLSAQDGIWINNIGAVRNINAVNMVTKTSLFDIENMKYEFEMLINSVNKKEKKLLKKYFNKLALKNQKLAYQRKIHLEKSLYKIVYKLNIFQTFCSLMFSIIPERLLQKIFE